MASMYFQLSHRVFDHPSQLVPLPFIFYAASRETSKNYRATSLVPMPHHGPLLSRGEDPSPLPHENSPLGPTSVPEVLSGSPPTALLSLLSVDDSLNVLISSLNSKL